MPLCTGLHEAHREQHQIGRQLELGARHLLHLHLAVAGSFFHSTRTATSAFTLPFSPLKRLVATAQSRLAPSSCERRGAQLGRPVRPHRVALLDRPAAAAAARTGSPTSRRGGWKCRRSPSRCRRRRSPPRACRWPRDRRTPLSPATRLFCSGRNSIAKWTPSSSRPGTGRSRGCSAPPDSTTASNSSTSCLRGDELRRGVAHAVAGRRVPTHTPVRNSTPSARICSMRRSISHFSILKSGMP